MTKVKDITDNAPNPDTIEILEGLLEDAKSGKLRSIVAVYGENDDSQRHAWSLDDRTSPRRLLAELTITNHEYITNLGLLEQDSILYKALKGGG